MSAFALLVFYSFFKKIKFIYFEWRLITLQYCIGFAIINMNLPQMYTCSQSFTPLQPPSPYHSSGSSQCTSPSFLIHLQPNNSSWSLLLGFCICWSICLQSATLRSLIIIQISNQVIPPETQFLNKLEIVDSSSILCILSPYRKLFLHAVLLSFVNIFVFCLVSLKHWLHVSRNFVFSVLFIPRA